MHTHTRARARAHTHTHTHTHTHMHTHTHTHKHTHTCTHTQTRTPTLQRQISSAGTTPWETDRGQLAHWPWRDTHTLTLTHMKSRDNLPHPQDMRHGVPLRHGHTAS